MNNSNKILYKYNNLLYNIMTFIMVGDVVQKNENNP